MDYIESFKKTFMSIHNENIQILKSYHNTTENLEELSHIFENILDYITTYIRKLSIKTKQDIINQFGKKRADTMLKHYYHKTLGYSHSEVNKYFSTYNLENKKVLLILQNAVGLDIYY